MSVVHSGVYSTDTQYDPTKCVYVEAGRAAKLPAVAIIPYGPIDCPFRSHFKDCIQYKTRFKGNVDALFLEICKKWLEKKGRYRDRKGGL